LFCFVLFPLNFVPCLLAWKSCAMHLCVYVCVWICSDGLVSLIWKSLLLLIIVSVEFYYASCFMYIGSMQIGFASCGFSFSSWQNLLFFQTKKFPGIFFGKFGFFFSVQLTSFCNFLGKKCQILDIKI
jgi:hypothetical protein